MTPLAGRRALVSGGSRGIGAAVCRQLAAAGAAVTVVARRAEAVEALVAELRAAGGQAEGRVCDVADPAAIEKTADATGAVDILVNNAGIGFSAPVRKLALEDWQRVFAVNVTGTFLLTRAYLPGMCERGWGRVVNVASVAALVGGPYIAAYAASKHAVLGFTRCAALEAAADGVTVNAVCPGYVDTEMTAESVARIAGKTGTDPALALERIVATSSQRRLLSAEEVAAQVVWLCRDESAGINGQAIVINGGGIIA